MATKKILSRKQVTILSIIAGSLFVLAGFYVFLVYKGYLRFGAEKLFGPSRGAALSKAAPKPSTIWYFAEGCSRIVQPKNREFHTYLSLYNPGPKDAKIKVTYAFLAGKEQGDPKDEYLDLKAGQRTSIYVNEKTDKDKDIAIRVESLPLSATTPTSEKTTQSNQEEKTKQDNTKSQEGRGGATVSVDSVYPYLVENKDKTNLTIYGSGFDNKTKVYLKKKNSSEIVATAKSAKLTTIPEGKDKLSVTFNLKDKKPGEYDILVKNSEKEMGALFKAVEVKKELTNEEKKEQKTETQAAEKGNKDTDTPQPIVAERVMYNIYEGRYSATSNVGSPVLAKKWYFPEGTTFSGFDEWLLIYNPNQRDINVKLNLYGKNGQKLKENYSASIPANRRFNFKVNDIVPEHKDDVSAVLESDYGFVAERALYFYNEQMQGSTTSFGLLIEPYTKGEASKEEKKEENKSQETPLKVTSVEPNSAFNEGEKEIIINGTGFQKDQSAFIELNSLEAGTQIVASNIQILSETQIRAKIVLNEAGLGSYNLTLKNPATGDGVREANLSNAFTVLQKGQKEESEIKIEKIEPASGKNDEGEKEITITGQGFKRQASVQLKLNEKSQTEEIEEGKKTIAAQKVVFDSEKQLRATFNFKNRYEGFYDVWVINPDQKKGVYQNGFELKVSESGESQKFSYKDSGKELYIPESRVTSNKSFDQCVAVFNPQNQSVTVKLYSILKGQTNEIASASIPSLSRHTFHINDYSSVVDKDDLALKLTADKEILAESSIYIDQVIGTNVYVKDGTCESAEPITRLTNTQYLPEGMVTKEQGKDFVEYLILFNPNPEKIEGKIKYTSTDDPNSNLSAEETSFSLNPLERKAILVNENKKIQGGHSILVETTTKDKNNEPAKVMAERVIYHNDIPGPQISSVEPNTFYDKEGAQLTVKGTNLIDVEAFLIDNTALNKSQYQVQDTENIKATISPNQLQAGDHTIKIKTKRGESNETKITVQHKEEPPSNEHKEEPPSNESVCNCDAFNQKAESYCSKDGEHTMMQPPGVSESFPVIECGYDCKRGIIFLIGNYNEQRYTQLIYDYENLKCPSTNQPYKIIKH